MWTRSSVRSIERSVNAGKLLITTTKDGRLLAERWKQRISKPFSPPLRWDVIADVLSIPNRWFLVQRFNLFVHLRNSLSDNVLLAKDFYFDHKIESFLLPSEDLLNISFCVQPRTTCSTLNHVTCRLDKSRRRSKLCLHNLLHLQASRILWFW